MRIGAVARDHDGAYLGRLSSSTDFFSQSLVTEFRTLWIALKFCNEMEFERVRLERNARVLINAINEEGEC